MLSVSIETARGHLDDLVERVQSDFERFVITRHDEPAAVLISSQDLESLEETVAILSDPRAVREIAAAEREIAEGDVVRGVDAARALRPI